MSLKCTLIFAQTDPLESYLTPDGVLDNVFDNEGNEYLLQDLYVSSDRINPANLTVAKTVQINCISTSYFNLFFQDGSGMEPVAGNALQTSTNAKKTRSIM